MKTVRCINEKKVMKGALHEDNCNEGNKGEVGMRVAGNILPLSDAATLS
jgi:hypothetical protein